MEGPVHDIYTTYHCLTLKITNLMYYDTYANMPVPGPCSSYLVRL